MPDKEYKIEVKTTADASGAQAVAAAVEKVTEATTASATATAQAAEQTTAAQNEAAAAAAKTAEAIGKGGETATAASAKTEVSVSRVAALLGEAEKKANDLAAASAKVPAEPMLASAQAAQKITDNATAAERAQSNLDRALQQASPAALKAVEEGLKRLITEEEAAGRSTEQLRSQLARVMAQPFDRAEESLRKSQESMKSLSGESESFLEKIKTGFGIDFAGKIIDGFQEIGHFVEETFRRGIEYNAHLETSGIALAASLKAAYPEKYLTFNNARSKGVEVLGLLQAKARDLGLDFRALTESFQINLQSMTEGGVHNLQKQIDLTVLLGQVAQAKGLSGFQATRDTTDLLLGQANRTMLGRELGIRDEDIKKAKEAGQTYEFLTEKLAAYKEAGAAGADTFAATVQSLKNDVEMLGGELAKPAFTELSRLLKELREPAGGLGAQGFARGLGNTIGGGVEGVEKVLAFLNQRGALTESFLNVIPGGGVIGRGVGGVVGSNLDAGQADVEADDRLKRITALREEIAAAHGAKAETEARKAVEKELTHAVKETSDATGEAQERAAQYLLLIKDIQNRFKDHVGKEVDNTPQKQAATDAKFREEIHGSDEFRLATAKASGDAGYTAEEQHAKDVKKQIQQLEKHYAQEGGSRPSPEAFKAQAEENVLLDEKAKALVEIRKENERIDRLTAKTDDLSDVRRKLAEKSKEFADAIPRGQRDKFSDEQIYSGNPATNGLREAVNATEMEATAKAKLLKIVGELVELEEKRVKIVQKESGPAGKAIGTGAGTSRTDADEAAAAQKQHDDALASQREEIAILRAKAAGQDDLAAKLEKEKELRAAIKTLMAENLTYEEALAVATENQNLNQTIKDKQFVKDHANDHDNDNPLAFRPGESAADYHKRTGGIDARAKDTDADGKMHGGIVGSDFVTNNPPVSSVSVRGQTPDDGSFVSPLNPAGGLASILAGSGVSGFFGGASTAGAAVAPLLGSGNGAWASGKGGDGGVAGGSGEGGDNGLAAAAQGTQKAAEGAQGAGDKAAQSAGTAAQSLGRAASALDKLKGKLAEIDQRLTEVENNASRLENTVNGLVTG